jgi:peptidoglycan hydrolase-like protein with peptidoglycan-binding domain
MSFARRFLLGVLSVALLAAAATAAGYAMRKPMVQPEPARTLAFSASDPTQAPAPVARPVADVQPEPSPAPRPPKPRVLVGPGDKGAAVRDVQARLKQIAWYFGDVTGQYGDATIEAVRGFQAKREIRVTGKVDRRTMARLRGMTTEPTRQELFNLGNTPGALDARCRVGRVLCVDKSSQTLRWVIDGRVQETVDVRFGSSYTPTREGTFSVYFMSRDHVSKLYDSAMPFAMFFSGGQAVHYSSDFAANGYSGASHGCVNVRDYDAVAWLYDQVQVGDKVVVYWS